MYKLAHGRGVPSSGVLEVFGEALSTHWWEGDEVVDLRLLIGPKILEKVTASVIFAALESSNERLSLAGLKRIGETLKVFAMTEVPDGCPANVRKMAFYAKQLPSNCLYFKAFSCVCHKAINIFDSTSDSKQLVGDVFATSYTCKLPRYRSTILDALHRVLDEELDLVAPTAVDSRIRQHVQDILDHTIRREWQFSRGSRLSGDVATDDEVQRAGQLRRASIIESNLTGDPRACKLQVIDGGTQRADVVIKVAAAISNGGLLLGVHSDMPAVNRWGSLSKHLSEQCAGNMFSQILEKTMRKAFPYWDTILELAGPEEDDDDQRKYNQSKCWRAVHCYQTLDAQRRSAVVSWTTVPIDHFWLEVQKMDVAGNSLLDSTWPPTNPFLKAQRAWGKMMTEPVDSGPLRAVFFHYATDEDALVDLTWQIRCDVLAYQAKFWFFFENMLDQLAVRSLRMIDVRRSLAEGLAVAREIKDAPL